MKGRMVSCLLLLALLSLSPFVLAGKWIPLKGNPTEGIRIALKESSSAETVLEYTLNGYHVASRDVNGKSCARITIPGTVPFMEKGLPALPTLRRSIIIPDQGTPTIRILEKDVVTHRIKTLEPSKGPITRDVDWNGVPYQFDSIYNKNAFFPSEDTALGEPFILRGIRGVNLQFNPLRYNPVLGELQVCTRLVIEVETSGSGGENSRHKGAPLAALEKNFKKICGKLFLNFDAMPLYTTPPEDGRMIIITYDGFHDDVIPLHDWKEQRGIPTEIHDLSSVGSTPSQIQTFISNKYQEPEGLAFVVLVGDEPLLPTIDGAYEGAAADPRYGMVDGTDYYPDVFISRISAMDSSQVQTQVDKIINYEKFPMAGADWYHKGSGIASNKTGGTGIRDWERCDLLRDMLLAYTYTSVDQIYDPEATAAEVTTAVNDGRSIINYVGHGTGTGWATTMYSNSDVAGLTNGYKMPFIVDVSCANGGFRGSSNCFAEEWMEAGTAGSPNGAVAMFASSTLTDWTPPCQMQNHINDLLTSDSFHTAGGLFFSGTMYVLDYYSGGVGYKLVEQYNIFGDCSLVVRTDTPSALTVNHNSTLFVGADTFAVSVPGVEDALCCISYENEVYGTAYTDAGGQATITLDTPFAESGIAQLTVTAYNAMPYWTDLYVIPTEGPFLVYFSHTLDDSSGNSNGQAEFGENISLDITIKNVGVGAAYSVTASLAEGSSYCTITDNSEAYGTLLAGQSLSIPDGFAFTVAGDVPDDHTVVFTLTMEDDQSEQWSSLFSIQFHAPLLVYHSFFLDDQSGGNGNGLLEGGETADLIVTLSNTGSADCPAVEGNLSENDIYTSIVSGSDTYGTIPAGETRDGTFTVSAHPASPEGRTVQFDTDFQGGGGPYSGTGSFDVTLGRIPVLIVDLDGNHNSASRLGKALTALRVPYETTLSWPTEWNRHASLFICLGIFSDNTELSTLQANELVAFLQSGGNVYMEGGNCWFYDANATVYTDDFGITGTELGTGDTETILGLSRTFAHGYSFNYDGDNRYMDHLSALPGAALLLQNQDPSYGNGVAFDAGTYRTIGVSFEFGGIENSASGTRLEWMFEILNFLVPHCEVLLPGRDKGEPETGKVRKIPARGKSLK